MRIYIVGQYCPKGNNMHDAARQAHQNVMKAIEAFHYLKKLGHEPFVSILNHFVQLEGDTNYGEWWYEYDLTFLEHWAEAIYLLVDWEQSHGAKNELVYARKKGLYIFEQGVMEPYSAAHYEATKEKER